MSHCLRSKRVLAFYRKREKAVVHALVPLQSVSLGVVQVPMCDTERVQGSSVNRCHSQRVARIKGIKELQRSISAQQSQVKNYVHTI